MAIGQRRVPVIQGPHRQPRGWAPAPDANSSMAPALQTAAPVEAVVLERRTARLYITGDGALPVGQVPLAPPDPSTFFTIKQICGIGTDFGQLFAFVRNSPVLATGDIGPPKFVASLTAEPALNNMDVIDSASWQGFLDINVPAGQYVVFFAYSGALATPLGSATIDVIYDWQRWDPRP